MNRCLLNYYLLCMSEKACRLQRAVFQGAVVFSLSAFCKYNGGGLMWSVMLGRLDESAKWYVVFFFLERKTRVQSPQRTTL